jgi:hypothetical protein
MLHLIVLKRITLARLKHDHLRPSPLTHDSSTAFADEFRHHQVEVDHAQNRP